MKKTIIVLMSLAVTLFAGTSFADEEILAKLTVCPQDTRFLKSTTVTLTKYTIRFDQVNGPWTISLGEPAQSTFEHRVLSIKPALGLFKKGLKVDFHSTDHAGPIIDMVRIYKDSLVTKDSESGELGTSYAKYCK